jgi:Fe-Mn family superoxide dismutase
LYFKNLAPVSRGGGLLPHLDSPLSKAIKETWGSMDKFIQDFNNRTAAIQGSGWGWLALDQTNKKLCILTTQN